MALVITPTLTITSGGTTGVFADQDLSLSATDAITVVAPLSDVSRMATNDNIGHGAGIILPDLVTARHHVYIKHTGLVSDGSADSDYGTTNNTTSHATTDSVIISNADGDVDENGIIILQPNEFAFFPWAGSDGVDGGVEPGGLKITSLNSPEVIVEFAYFASAI
tara:strand:- start:277 stop:771 length:495 start_codon:yes stop_codon:yes gene_type:complete